MSESLLAHQLISLQTIDKFDDGALVKQVGQRNFNICQNGIFKMLTADKKHVCQTMLDLYAMKGMIVGPAVALSVASLALIQDQIKNKVSYVLFPEETSIQKDSRKSAKWRLLRINILSFFS